MAKRIHIKMTEDGPEGGEPTTLFELAMSASNLLELTKAPPVAGSDTNEAARLYLFPNGSGGAYVFHHSHENGNLGYQLLFVQDSLQLGEHLTRLGFGSDDYHKRLNRIAEQRGWDLRLPVTGPDVEREVSDAINSMMKRGAAVASDPAASTLPAPTDPAIKVTPPAQIPALLRQPPRRPEGGSGPA
jgi:hypothetical protein